MNVSVTKDLLAVEKRIINSAWMKKTEDGYKNKHNTTSHEIPILRRIIRLYKNQIQYQGISSRSA